jgi:hypothetical protein
MIEQSTHHPKIEDSNPATGTMREPLAQGACTIKALQDRNVPTP